MITRDSDGFSSTISLIKICGLENFFISRSISFSSFSHFFCRFSFSRASCFSFILASTALFSYFRFFLHSQHLFGSSKPNALNRFCSSAVIIKSLPQSLHVAEIGSNLFTLPIGSFLPHISLFSHLSRFSNRCLLLTTERCVILFLFEQRRELTTPSISQICK